MAARFRLFLASVVALALLVSGVRFCRAETPEQIVAGIDDRIERHRKRDVELQLIMPDGTLVPAGAHATATLLKHEFLFGCNIFSYGYQEEGEAQYRQRFEKAFNYATLNFIWKYYEPKPGQSEQRKWQEVARWCQSRGISAKGHPLVWSMEPGWVRQAGPGRDEQLVWQRTANEVRRFSGLIDTWDVVNESTEGVKYARDRNATGILRAYNRLGIAGTIAKATSVARQANPGSKLVLNDFVTTDEYTKVVQGALDAGATIDAVGIQSHMHTGYWRVAKLWDVCNRLGKSGKPVHFTELSILSGRLKHENDTDWETKRTDWHSTPRGEEIQAAQVYETYRLLFSHPSVEAISWWDLSDRGAWLGAPAGLLRYDMTPKPAYYRVYDLIHKGWTTNASSVVGDEGTVSLRGFFGDYGISATVNGQVLRGSFQNAKRAAGKGLIQVQLKP